MTGSTSSGAVSTAPVRERMRPEAQHRQDLFDRQLRAVNAALDLFEAADLPSDRFGIAEIAIAVQLAYLDVRQVVAWRPGRTALSAWYEAVSKRTSMIATDASAT